MPPPAHLDPPDDFEPTQAPDARPRNQDRPEWLAGIDDLCAPPPGETPAGIPLVKLVRPTAAPEPAAHREGGESTAAREAAPASGRSGPADDRADAPLPDAHPRSWARSPTSVPRLNATPFYESPVHPDTTPGVPEESVTSEPMAFAAEEAPPQAAGSVARTEVAPAPPEEPRRRTWSQVLLTNRVLQAGLVVVLGLACAATFLGRSQAGGVSLASIKLHPERYENLSVRVHGEVIESFQVGRGYVFQLRQGADTVVVYSPTRHPARHDKIAVEGTVSTGYLDGQPRVALFEGSNPAPAR
jgi:hypothetical protein